MIIVYNNGKYVGGFIGPESIELLKQGLVENQGMVPENLKFYFVDDSQHTLLMNQQTGNRLVKIVEGRLDLVERIESQSTRIVEDVNGPREAIDVLIEDRVLATLVMERVL